MYAIINGVTPRGGVSYVSVAYEHTRDIGLLYTKLTDQWPNIRQFHMNVLKVWGFNPQTHSWMYPPVNIGSIFSKKTVTMFCKLLSCKYREAIWGSGEAGNPKSIPVGLIPEIDRDEPFHFGGKDPVPVC